MAPNVLRSGSGFCRVILDHTSPQKKKFLNILAGLLSFREWNAKSVFQNSKFHARSHDSCGVLCGDLRVPIAARTAQDVFVCATHVFFGFVLRFYSIVIHIYCLGITEQRIFWRRTTKDIDFYTPFVVGFVLSPSCGAFQDFHKTATVSNNVY